jgi:hypothetical protein
MSILNQPSLEQEISLVALRKRGFRLIECWGNYELHMRIEVDRNMDTFLELGPVRDESWSCWIVSEMAQRYGRMCFLRTVKTMADVERLYQGLTDAVLPFVEDFDREGFARAVEQMSRSAQHRFKKIYTDQLVRKHMMEPS